MLESCFCFAFSMMVPKPQVEKIVGKKKLPSTVEAACCCRLTLS